ncbi:MAG: hypothetical protein HYW70_02200 [Candidatus Nealsonbacteria bacterium]|nr:hypothetical protein [Candidatus Nealsonbacteria bacterium]
MVKVRSTFSISYKNFLDQGTEWTVDWNWWGEWRGFSRKFGTLNRDSWEEAPFIGDMAYEAILKKFGLEEWPEEFPRDSIVKMSPAELIAKRREKEQSFPELSRLMAVSDFATPDKEAELAENYAP